MGVSTTQENRHGDPISGSVEMTDTQYRKYDQILDAIPDLVMVMDKEHRIVYANKAMLTQYGEDMIGMKCWEVLHGTDGPVAECPHAMLIRDGREHLFEMKEHALGKTLMVSTTPLYDVDGSVDGCVHVIRDISYRKKTELAMAQKNAAMQELIEQVAVEKSRIQKSVAENLEEIVIPILSKIRLKGSSQKYVDLLEHHLRNIFTTYTTDTLRNQVFRLTPREKEICSMIKAGLTSKEIAELLFISVQTVHRHRRNIRHRLHLTGEKQNLASFLRDQ